ncbi:TPA: hypothetical protein JD264_18575 [Serratia fonticola]|nr:hypothetical protein [Serratia fonticola]
MLKRRRSGQGWAFATLGPVTGSAGLTAPDGISAVLNGFWRLHAAHAAFTGQAAHCSPVRLRLGGQ